MCIDWGWWYVEFQFENPTFVGLELECCESEDGLKVGFENQEVRRKVV